MTTATNNSDKTYNVQCNNQLPNDKRQMRQTLATQTTKATNVNNNDRQRQQTITTTTNKDTDQ